MNPLFLLRDCLARAFARKWIPAALLILFLSSTVCGIVFIKTPVFYEYHLRVCDRFLDRVVYSDRSVFLIFLERGAGNLLLLALILAGGIHPAALLLPAVVVAYRAYLFGGTLAILFTVYGASGAFVAFALYLPVQIAVCAVLLIASALSFARAFCFRFCGADLKGLLSDCLALAAALFAAGLIEMLLLGALFHPLGNLI